MDNFNDFQEISPREICTVLVKYCFMKKLKYYPNMWQTYPFSLDLFIHAEREAAKKETEKKERKTKFKLALGW